MNRFNKSLAATFLPAAMLFTGTAQPRVLGGWSATRKLPPRNRPGGSTPPRPA
jgi:hypothetical protein